MLEVALLALGKPNPRKAFGLGFQRGAPGVVHDEIYKLPAVRANGRATGNGPVNKLAISLMDSGLFESVQVVRMGRKEEEGFTGIFFELAMIPK